jgi:mannose/fructose/N-acetylgalactosamine-specific phosphotransferase system component IID
MLNDEQATMVQKKLLQPIKIGGMIPFGGIGVGAIFILIAVILHYKPQKGSNK